MATKPKQDEVKAEKATPKPQLIQHREVVVGKEPTKSFEERTTVTQPWLDKDGEQVNQ